MCAELSENLSRISAAAAKLNTTAEVLTQQVVALSEHLRQLQVGVSCYFTREGFRARTDDPEGEHDPEGRPRAVPCCHFIGFDKADDGKWCVAVACRTDGEGGPAPPVEGPDSPGARTLWVRPFESCPRNVRLALAPHIPELVEGLAAAVENVTAAAQTSLGDLEKISKDLQAALAKKPK